MKNNKDSIQVETRVSLRDVMKYNPTTTESETTVTHAAAAMCRDEVGSCIVLQNNRPVGIITEEDINCKVVAKGLNPAKVYVKDVMSTPLITIESDKTITDAVHLMVKSRVRRLPVIEDHNVIGMVTVRDILSVTSEINEIMADLIEINREETYEVGVCDRCGQMSDDLVRIDNMVLCPGCREEERLV